MDSVAEILAKFPMGNIWESTSQEEKDQYVNVAYSVLAQYGISSLEDLQNSSIKQFAFAQYLRFVVERGGVGVVGEDGELISINPPPAVVDTLTKNLAENTSTPVQLAYSDAPADAPSTPGTDPGTPATFNPNNFKVFALSGGRLIALGDLNQSLQNLINAPRNSSDPRLPTANADDTILQWNEGQGRWDPRSPQDIRNSIGAQSAEQVILAINQNRVNLGNLPRHIDDIVDFFTNTFSHSNVTTESYDLAPGVSNLGSYRGDATAHSNSNNDGLIETGTAKFNSSRCSFSGLTYPTPESGVYLNAHIKEVGIVLGPQEAAQVILGFHYNGLDYPQLRINGVTGRLESNHSGTRQNQDWQGLSGLVNGSSQPVIFQHGSTGHVTVEWHANANGDIEFIAAARQIGGSNPRTWQIPNFIETNHNVAVDEVRSDCRTGGIFEVWNDTYRRHQEQADDLADNRVDEVGLGKVSVQTHSTTRDELRGHFDIKGSLVINGQPIGEGTNDAGPGVFTDVPNTSSTITLPANYRSFNVLHLTYTVNSEVRHASILVEALATSGSQNIRLQGADDGNWVASTRVMTRAQSSISFTHAALSGGSGVAIPIDLSSVEEAALKVNSSTRWPKSKVPSDTVYSAQINAFQNSTQVTTIVNNRINALARLRNVLIGVSDLASDITRRLLPSITSNSARRYAQVAPNGTTVTIATAPAAFLQWIRVHSRVYNVGASSSFPARTVTTQWTLPVSNEAYVFEFVDIAGRSQDYILTPNQIRALAVNTTSRSQNIYQGAVIEKFGQHVNTVSGVSPTVIYFGKNTSNRLLFSVNNLDPSRSYAGNVTLNIYREQVVAES